jgi:hypothetical protein
MRKLQVRHIIIIVLLGILALIYFDPSFLNVFSHASFTIPPSANHVVTGSSTLTGKAIDMVLCNNASPACGTGEALHNDAVIYQINDAYALATFNKESSYGKAGVARITHSLGNIRCTAGYQCYEGFRAYATWEAGYRDFFSLIRGQYVNSWHLSTVEAIIPKYAPSSENNTPKYVSDVIDVMNSYK